MVVWRSGRLVIMEKVKGNKVVFEDVCVMIGDLEWSIIECLTSIAL
jgi:hypothetical protein